MLLQKAEENKDYKEKPFDEKSWHEKMLNGYKNGPIMLKMRRTGALNMQKIMKDMMDEK